MLPNLGRLSLRTGADAGPSDAGPPPEADQPDAEMVDPMPSSLVPPPTHPSALGVVSPEERRAAVEAHKIYLQAYAQALTRRTLKSLANEIPMDPVFVPDPVTWPAELDRLRLHLVAIANRLNQPNTGLPPPFALIENFRSYGGIENLAVTLDTMVKYRFPTLPPQLAGVEGGANRFPIREGLMVLANVVQYWAVHKQIESVGLIETIETHVANTDARNVKTNMAVLTTFLALIRGLKIGKESYERIGKATWLILKATLHEDETPAPPPPADPADGSTLQQEHGQNTLNMKAQATLVLKTMWNLALVPDWYVWAEEATSPGGTMPTTWFEFFAKVVLLDGFNAKPDSEGAIVVPPRFHGSDELEEDQVGEDVGEWSLPNWKKRMALDVLPKALVQFVYYVDHASVRMLLRLLTVNITECMEIFTLDGDVNVFNGGIWRPLETEDARLGSDAEIMAERTLLVENIDRQFVRLAKLLLPLDALLHREDVQELVLENPSIVDSLVRLVEYTTQNQMRTINRLVHKYDKVQERALWCLESLARGNAQAQELLRETHGISGKLPRKADNWELSDVAQPLFYLINTDNPVLVRALSVIGVTSRIVPRHIEMLSNALPGATRLYGSATHVAILESLGMARLWRAYRHPPGPGFHDDAIPMRQMYGLLGRLVQRFPAARDACRTKVPEMFGDIVRDAFAHRKDDNWIGMSIILVDHLIGHNNLNQTFFGLDYQDGPRTRNMISIIIGAILSYETDMESQGLLIKNTAIGCLKKMITRHDDNLDKVRLHKHQFELKMSLQRLISVNIVPADGDEINREKRQIAMKAMDLLNWLAV